MASSRRLSAALAALCVLIAGLLFSSTPALAAPPEQPVTEAATAVTASTATLHGELNPLTEATVGYDFTYNTNGTCEPGATTEPVVEKAKVKAEKVFTPATGLEPNKGYTFCVVATNVVEGVPGASSGAPLPFKTLPAPPKVDTQSASAVNSTSATLEAQVNPNNQSTTFTFEYATKATGEKLEGAIVKLPGAEPLVAEFGDRTATVPRVEGLTPGTTYHYRVVAENEQSKKEKAAVKGVVQSFTTVPTPFTDPVTAITATSATLNGHLTLNPVDTMFSFAYNLGEACTGLGTAPGDAGSGPGTEAKESAPVAELQPNALYTACFQTSNVSGSEQGPPVSFKTLAVPPTVANESSAEVSSTGATLKAGINPNNQETTYSFEYATNEALTGATTVNGASPLTASFGEQLVSVKTGALAPRTPYFYRAVATNAKAEKTEGKLESFTTLAKPIVTTGEAQNPTRTTAVLSGTVNPGGLATTYHFVYDAAADYTPGAGECPAGLACAYGHAKTTPNVSIGSDYAVHAASPLTAEELKPGTTYDYALVATNAEGTEIGPNQSFTTAPGTLPVAVTGEATGVTQLSATLTGAVNTQGLQTVLQFEFGTTPEQGLLVPASAIPGSESGSTVGIAHTFLSTLQSGTTYYYRTVATNQDGTSYGVERSFTTGSFPGLPALIAVPIIVFPANLLPVEPKVTTPTTTKALTKAQKLAKALKACSKKPKKRRTSCKRQAHKRYGR